MARINIPLAPEQFEALKNSKEQLEQFPFSFNAQDEGLITLVVHADWLESYSGDPINGPGVLVVTFMDVEKINSD